MLFITHRNKEQLLKSINRGGYQKEYDDFVSVDVDEVETAELPSELLIIRTMFESLKPVHFGDIVEKLKTISAQERVIINNVITIIKIVLTTGATRATPEKSFSSARQLKPGFDLLSHKNAFTIVRIIVPCVYICTLSTNCH